MHNGQDINCSCGKIHRLSTTALGLVLQAFIDGNAQRVSRDGVNSMCARAIASEYRHLRRKDRVIVL